MKLLLIAPSFPSINQPWINTHIEQLRDKNVDFDIVSFNKNFTEHTLPKSIKELTRKTIFISNDSREIMRDSMGLSLFHLTSFLIHFIANLRHCLFINVTVRDKIILSLKGAYFCKLFGANKKYDLIHVHFDQAVENILSYSLATKTPYITTFHGLNPVGVKIYDPRKRLASYQNAHTVFLNTKFAAKQAINMGCTPDKIRILPQSLPKSIFTYKERTYPLKKFELTILTVGRLQRDKGQVYALHAIQRLLKLGYRLNWYIVGSGPDKDYLVNICNRLNIGPFVHFISDVTTEKLVEIYHNSDIFVLPSISNTKGYHVETQGVVLQEAQACVLPCYRIRCWRNS